MEICTNFIALSCYVAGYLPVGGQPIPGPHPGPGRAEVAEIWLAMRWVFDEENDAAAALATTMASITTRKASFIPGYSLRRPINRKGPSLTQKIVVQFFD
jgi:hypothetical protein